MDCLEFRACFVRFSIIGKYMRDRDDPLQDITDGSEISCGHGRVAHGRVAHGRVCSDRLRFPCPQLAEFSCLHWCEVRGANALFCLPLQIFCIAACFLWHAAGMLVLRLHECFSLECAYIL